MAEITITIPDEHVRHFALYKGYKDKLETEDGKSINNPETELEHANRILVEYVRNGVRNHCAECAGKEAAKAHLEANYDDIK